MEDAVRNQYCSMTLRPHDPMSTYFGLSRRPLEAYGIETIACLAKRPGAANLTASLMTTLDEVQDWFWERPVSLER